MKLPAATEITPDAVAGPADNNLSVKELSRFLKDLGKSLQRAGDSPALGEALVQLSEALGRHPHKELSGVLESLAQGVPLPERRVAQSSKVLAGIDLRALDTAEVKTLLEQEPLSKQDLVQVGATRFGLGKARLERQSRQSILDAIASALNGEESYRVIGAEARKEGLRRAKV